MENYSHRYTDIPKIDGKVTIDNHMLPTNSFVKYLISRNQSKNINIAFKYRNIKDNQQYRWVTNAIRGNENEYDRESLNKEINSWNPYTPVLISAQTGRGKNTFIKDELLEKVWNENLMYHRNDKILLLSNRVALSRQTKYEYAQKIRDITGNDSYIKKFNEELQEKGIDKFTDFGFVTICSYHQVFGKLEKNQYKYIICDECHFFTSDSTFNSNTDHFLEYIVSKGGKAIRIYMTSTLESAFESIIRAETQWMENKFINLGINPEEFYKIPNSRLVHPYEQNFHFYYISRNYDYVDTIFGYENYGEILEEIKESKEKWIIFVSSKKNGSQLLDDMTQADINCVFLSRDNIQNKAIKPIYDNIIKNEKFDNQVLITTSLLDNGINIKDSEVKNVVIDVFDKTEFIQMLGRIRINDGEKIKLYIRNYQLKDLEKMLINIVEKLVIILFLDLLNNEQKINWYEALENHSKYSNLPKKLFKKVNDGSGLLIVYEKNTVYKLIENANRLLRLIRNIDTDFFIKLNQDIQDEAIKIYNKYISDDKFRQKSWSRSIVDILTNAREFRKRKELEYAEKNDIPYRLPYSTYQNDENKIKLEKEIEDKYALWYEKGYNCSHYLYYHLLPSYFEQQILSFEGNKFIENYESAIKNIPNTANIINDRIMRTASMLKDSQKLNDDYKHYLDLIHYHQQWEQINYNEYTFSLDEQASWIEKKDYILLSEKNNKISINTNIAVDNNATENETLADSDSDNIENDLYKKIINDEEYKNNKIKESNENDSDKKEYRTDQFPLEYLNRKGIKNDSEEGHFLAKKCGNKHIKKIKNEFCCIKDIKVQIRSVHTIQKGERKTYFLLVKINPEISQL